MQPEDFTKGERNDGIVEVAEIKFKESYFKVEGGEGYGEYGVTVGVSPDTCKDDETFGDFKKRLSEEFKKITGEDAVPSLHVEGWYDG